MGSHLARFEFTPEENEQIETEIKVPKEPRSIIHGIVQDTSGRLIEDAVVKLFIVEDPCNPCSLIPVTHTFTDSCGEFVFGPLIPGKQYMIKIWVNETNIKRVVIRPDVDAEGRQRCKGHCCEGDEAKEDIVVNCRDPSSVEDIAGNERAAVGKKTPSSTKKTSSPARPAHGPAKLNRNPLKGGPSL